MIKPDPPCVFWTRMKQPQKSACLSSVAKGRLGNGRRECSGRVMTGSLMIGFPHEAGDQ
jgi:hypothetical protein